MCCFNVKSYTCTDQDIFNNLGNDTSVSELDPVFEFVSVLSADPDNESMSIRRKHKVTAITLPHK